MNALLCGGGFQSFGVHYVGACSLFVLSISRLATHLGAARCYLTFVFAVCHMYEYTVNVDIFFMFFCCQFRSVAFDLGGGNG